MQRLPCGLTYLHCVLACILGASIREYARERVPAYSSPLAARVNEGGPRVRSNARLLPLPWRVGVDRSGPPGTRPRRTRIDPARLDDRPGAQGPREPAGRALPDSDDGPMAARARGGLSQSQPVPRTASTAPRPTRAGPGPAHPGPAFRNQGRPGLPGRPGWPALPRGQAGDRSGRRPGSGLPSRRGASRTTR